MKIKTLRGKSQNWNLKKIDWNGKSPSKLQQDCKAVLSLFWGMDKVAEEQPMPGTKNRFDFVNFDKKVIVEANGGQHFKYNKFFHQKNIFNFVASTKRDEDKRKFAELNGFAIIEVKSGPELNRIMLQISQ